MNLPAVGVPEGYRRFDETGCTLIVRSEHAAAVRSAGFGRVDGWTTALRRVGGSGRGRAVAVALEGGTELVLKRMCRGGAFASLWRGRFAGFRRLLDNLRVPLEARHRGVATATPVALLLAREPFGLYRAWLATQRIAYADDLRRVIAGGDRLQREHVDAIARAIRRMHDAGVDHPDLSLGNLLLQREPGRPPCGWVVDLDRARLYRGPLDWRRRARALRRLERSSVKSFGERPLAEFDLRRAWYEAYADGDADDQRRLERARRGNRLLIGLHRLGWH